MYSEPLKLDNLNVSSNQTEFKGFIRRHPKSETGCLYTGDSNLTKKKQVDTILNKIRNYQKTIGIFQVPHHGSRKNMNLKSLKLVESNNFRICIVSAGAKRAKHPSKVDIPGKVHHPLWTAP